jgi:deoxyribonuclease V
MNIKTKSPLKSFIKQTINEINVINSQSTVQAALYENLTPGQAIAYQHELRRQIEIRPLDKAVKIIGGADISFNKYSEVVYAGIILLKYPELTIMGHATAISKTKFPYISGLLAFREVPALLEA